MLSASAAATYAYHGAIHLHLALAMFAGSCIGSYVSARYSDRLGNVWQFFYTIFRIGGYNIMKWLDGSLRKQKNSRKCGATE